MQGLWSTADGQELPLPTVETGRSTFELSGRQRQDAMPGPVKMYGSTTGPGLVACRWPSV